MPGNSVRYQTEYYCVTGHHWINKENAQPDKNNMPCCPTHKQRLRTKSRKNRIIKKASTNYETRQENKLHHQTAWGIIPLPMQAAWGNTP